jgi:hypothetical protein
MSGHFTTGYMSVGEVSAGKLVLTNTTSNQDAVDRLRTSSTTTLFSSSAATKLDLIKECVFKDTGCAVANDGYGANVLTVANTSGKQAIIQSSSYISFPLGKSRITTLACILNTTGTIGRVGLFDSTVQTNKPGNGHFFQLTVGTVDVMSVVMRANCDDDIESGKIIQSAWNIDKMDGTGPSGHTISVWRNAPFIFVIDEQCCGKIRYGLYVNGIVCYVHYLTTSVHQTKLPVRFELTSDGSSGSMSVFYSSVELEGGFNYDYASRSGAPQFSLAWPNPTQSTINVAAGPCPLITLRLTDRTTLHLKNISIATNGLINWGVCVHPDSSLASLSTFTSVSTYSSTSFYSNPGTVTFAAGIFTDMFIPGGSNGVIVSSGMAMSGLTTCDVTGCILDLNIDGTPRLLTLFARTFSDNVGISASLTWSEINS